MARRATLQRCRRYGRNQVALEDTIRADVAAGTRHTCRVDIGGIQVDTWQPGSDRRTDKAPAPQQRSRTMELARARHGLLDREGWRGTKTPESTRMRRPQNSQTRRGYAHELQP
jgi:hypothetical protein